MLTGRLFSWTHSCVNRDKMKLFTCWAGTWNLDPQIKSLMLCRLCSTQAPIRFPWVIIFCSVPIVISAGFWLPESVSLISQVLKSCLRAMLQLSGTFFPFLFSYIFLYGFHSRDVSCLRQHCWVSDHIAEHREFHFCKVPHPKILSGHSAYFCFIPLGMPCIFVLVRRELKEEEFERCKRKCSVNRSLSSLLVI